ncbi:Plasmodium vivax Vir protein, putative [Plasmodium ovale]|uniref:Plasmodium vivax Vir protein, putative n=1 Tax=Plasmodium ovale TaxID=36330 RepID=A0A1C3KWI7_PLAOA|nr:Plasmodium vivax Vir protein, putative [Plasmodium ovale]
MDNILEDITNQHSFLKLLPLHKFYQEMNEDDNKTIESNSTCKTYIISSQSAANNLIELCQKAESILKSLERSFLDESKNSDKERYCNYFKYWLNFNANKIDKGSHSYNYNMLYRSIMTYNITLEQKYTCNNITDIGSDKNDFDETSKKLFFLTESLYWLRKEYSVSNKPETSSILNYLGYCTDFYNKILCTQKCNENARYRLNLEEFQEEFNKTNEHLLKLPELKKEELESPIQHKCKEQPLPLCNLETRAVEWAKFSIPDVDDYYDYRMGSGLSTIMTTVTFSIIIIFLFLLFLYKFTPFGSSLRNYLQRKNRIRNILNEFTNKFLRKYENNEINSENRTYSIPYKYEQDF